MARKNSLSTLRALALVVSLSAAAVASVSVSPTNADPGRDEGTAVARLAVYVDQAGRDRLSRDGYDMAGRDREQGFVEVIATAQEVERLAAEGYRFDVIEWRRSGPSPLGASDASGGEPDGPLPDTQYTDPAEMEAYLQQVAADHPAITRLEALGSSHEGRTIWGLLISDNAASDEDELAILFNAAHHAREVMTPEILIDTIDYLTDRYGSDPDVTAYVDAYQIWCVPIVNPDGVARVHEVDDFWRKNVRDNDLSGSIGSSDGVDLNRNYEWGWGNQCLGSSSSFGSQTYRGPTEGSEPETQTMLDLGRRYRPVFDVEYHSYGEDVFYAASCDPAFSPKLTTIADTDKSISRVIAEEYASRIVQADGGQGYAAAPYGGRVDGTGRDQQYFENGSIAFVTEVNNSGEGGFHPDYGTWRQPTVEGQRPGWLWLLERMAGPAVGGSVRDAATGQPIAADLSLDEMELPDGKRLTSEPDFGRFHVVVVPGAYTLRVEATGYAPAVVELTVGATFEPVVVELEPLGASTIVDEPFEDPTVETTWSVGSADDTATAGVWAWGEPHGTHTGDILGLGGTLQFGAPRIDATPGQAVHAFVTGNAQSAGFDVDEVDGGLTSLTSPSYDLSGRYGVEVRWQRWFRKDVTDLGDSMTVEASNDGGTTWVELDRLTAPTATADAMPAWTSGSFTLDTALAPGPDVRFRFRVADVAPDHVVEGAIDDFELSGYSTSTQGRVSEVRLDDAAATELSWSAVPGPGPVYDVARGDLAALVGSGGSVDLGVLTCIEDDSVDLSTAGDADSEVPEAGSAFFYVVRFQLGFSSGGYGEASDGRPRSGDGGCSGP